MEDANSSEDEAVASSFDTRRSRSTKRGYSHNGTYASIAHFESEMEDSEDSETEEEVEEEESEEVPVSESEDDDDADGSSEEVLVTAADILARHAAAARAGERVITPTTPSRPASWVKPRPTKRVVKTVHRTVLIPRRRRNRVNPPPSSSPSRSQDRPSVDTERERLLADIVCVFREGRRESRYGGAASGARRMHLAMVQSKLDKNRPLPLLQARGELQAFAPVHTEYSSHTIPKEHDDNIYEMYNVGSCTESVPASVAPDNSQYGGTVATAVHDAASSVGVGSRQGSPYDHHQHHRALLEAHAEEVTALQRKITELEKAAEVSTSLPPSPSSEVGGSPSAVYWKARFATLTEQMNAIKETSIQESIAADSDRLELTRTKKALDLLKAERTVEEAKFEKKEASLLRELTHAETKVERHRGEADSLRSDLVIQESRLRDACRIRDEHLAEINQKLDSSNALCVQQSARIYELEALLHEDHHITKPDTTHTLHIIEDPPRRSTSNPRRVLNPRNTEGSPEGSPNIIDAELRTPAPHSVSPPLERRWTGNIVGGPGGELGESISPRTVSSSVYSGREVSVLQRSQRSVTVSSNPRNAENEEEIQITPSKTANRVRFGATKTFERDQQQQYESNEEQGAPPQSSDSPVGGVQTPRSSVLSHRGGGGGGGGSEAIVIKKANEPLGAKFRGEGSLTLEGVEEATPAMRHGVAVFLGARLTHINDTIVRDCNDVRQLALASTRVVLRFDTNGSQLG